MAKSPSPFNLTEMLSAVATGVQRKQAETERFTRVQNEQSQRVAQSTQQLTQFAQSNIEKLDDLTAKRKRADQLARSNNILDRATLLGEQMLNPRDYTSAGRTQQRGAISQDLAMRSQLHAVTAQDAKANIDAAAARVSGEELKAAMATEEIRATVEATQLHRMQLQEAELTRGLKLAQLDQPTLREHLAKQGAGGKVEIGGLEYTPTEVREQLKTLQAREELSRLSPAVTDPDYASKLNTYHRLQLQTMKLPELKQLKATGGLMSDGTQVEMSTIDTMLQSKLVEEADKATEFEDRFIVENMLPTAVEQSGPTLRRYRQAAVDSPLLQQALSSYEVATGALAAAAKSGDVTPTMQRKLLQTQAVASQQFLSAAESEAKRIAGNDKDMKEIVLGQMLGQDMPPEYVREVIAKRVVEGKPVSRLVPEAKAPRLRQLFNDEYMKAREQEVLASSLDPTAVKKKDKEIKQEAAQRAVERLGDEILGDTMVRMQYTAPMLESFPDRDMSPAQMQAIVVEADNAALKETQKKYDLSDSEMLKVKRGESIPDKPMAEILEFRRTAAYENEYMFFEARKPGLGIQVADWYAMESEALLQRGIKQLDPVVQSLIGDKAQVAVADLTERWMATKTEVGLTGARKLNEYFTSSTDSRYVNAMLLQMDEKLNPEQRKALWNELVLPTITRGKEAGASEEQIMLLVEKVLQEAKPENAAVRSALSAHRLHRMDLQNNYKIFREELLYNQLRKSLQAGDGTNLFRDRDAQMMMNSALRWAYEESDGTGVKR